MLAGPGGSPIRLVWLVAAALVAMGVTGSVAADEVQDPTGTACVHATGSAQCTKVAVSGTGDAETDSRSGSAVAASGTGNATSHSEDHAAVAASGTGDAAASNDPIDGGLSVAASGTGDATTGRGYLGAAASGTGNATGTFPASVTGSCRGRPEEAYRPCHDVALDDDARGYHLAVSGTEDARGRVAASGTGGATGSFPLSVTGGCRGDARDPYRPCHDEEVDDDAHGHYLAASGTGNATAVEGFLSTAASGTGDARAHALAASGTGDARSFEAAASGTGDARGYVAAASGTGNATSPLAPASAAGGCRDRPDDPYRPCYDAGVDGDARGHYGAASGTGNATTHGRVSGIAVSGTGDAAADGLLSLAVAGTGDATAEFLAAASGTGSATGCAAVSGTGEASAGCHLLVPVSVSGCRTVRDATGSEAACQDADPNPPLP